MGRVNTFTESFLNKESKRYEDVTSTEIIHKLIPGIDSFGFPKDGYNWLVGPFNNGKHYQRRICKIVAEAYLENLTGVNEVRHKNGNTLDDRVENLEWVTPGK